MIEECAVCFDETTDCVKPCDHPVCRKCVNKWVFSFNGNTCPLCRQPILYDTSSNNDDRVVQTHTGSFFGVTVQNTTTGRGVMVTHLEPRDLIHTAGIRTGSIITHINGVPVNEHYAAIYLLEHTTDGPVRIRLHNQTRVNCVYAVFRRIRESISTHIWRRGAVVQERGVRVRTSDSDTQRVS